MILEMKKKFHIIQYMVVQLKNLFLSFVHYKILAEQYFQSTVFCVIKINFPRPYIHINYKKNTI